MMLSHDTELKVRQSVADNRITTDSVKEILIRDSEVLVRNCEPVTTETIDEETLRMFAASESCFVRGYVASCPDAPADLLKKLSSDESPEVRMRVAANCSTHPATLHLMCGDENTDVKVSIVSNLHAPFAALSALARDKDAYIRTLVARTPWVLGCTLEVLTKDSDLFVRRTALSRLDAKVKAKQEQKIVSVQITDQIEI